MLNEKPKTLPPMEGVIHPQLYEDANGFIRPLNPRKTKTLVKPVSRPWWGLPTLGPRTAKRVGTIITLAIAALIMLAIMVEWIAGCGEVTYNADRTWVSNECVFQDRPITRGKW